MAIGSIILKKQSPWHFESLDHFLAQVELHVNYQLNWYFPILLRLNSRMHLNFFFMVYASALHALPLYHLRRRSGHEV